MLLPYAGVAVSSVPRKAVAKFGCLAQAEQDARMNW